MKTKIRRWGNSLALRIPRSLAQDANVRVGSTVELKINEGRLVVEPAAEPRYELRELLARVTKSNIHGEVPTGRAVGLEAW